MRSMLFATGLIAIAFGLLFTLQGLGVVRWPAESFMIGQTQWVYYGAMIAILGLFLALFARR